MENKGKTSLRGETMTSERTHEIEDKNIMTADEYDDLLNWYFQESASAYWKALEIQSIINS